ncbi:MAG TPA: hypothetical protein VG265_15490 [Gaiellaceae bacterium]|jgi:hypothetical protein|nr:hypothetical protein [Gaiellaceae bacterium]
MSTPKQQPDKPWAGNTGAWQTLATHDITLFSGMQVTITIPDVSALMHGEAIPDTLRRAAVQELIRPDGVEGAIAEKAKASENDPVAEAEVLELVKQGLELRRWAGWQCLVTPSLPYKADEDTPPETFTYAQVPPADRELLSQIAMRERNTDARGVVLGVVTLDVFARFRHHHDCPADCKACEALQREVSTLHPVDVL